MVSYKHTKISAARISLKIWWTSISLALLRLAMSLVPRRRISPPFLWTSSGYWSSMISRLALVQMVYRGFWPSQWVLFVCQWKHTENIPFILLDSSDWSRDTFLPPILVGDFNTFHLYTTQDFIRNGGSLYHGYWYLAVPNARPNPSHPTHPHRHVPPWPQVEPSHAMGSSLGLSILAATGRDG